MPFTAALSQHPLATHAVGEVVGQVLEELGEAPDAIVLIVTPPFAGALDDIAATVRATLRPKAMIGTTASGVLVGSQEVEHGAAIALFAMRFGLDGSAEDAPCRAVPLAVSPGRDGEGRAVTADVDLAIEGATVVLLADAGSFPTEEFVTEITSRAPGLTVVGGVASTGPGGGTNRFVADALVSTTGAVALVVPGAVDATPLVSQGCEPVGEPFVVTEAAGNVVIELAGRPALDRLMEQVDAASPGERSRMARGLQVGLVVDERKADFERDDFLVRDVLGADHARRAVAIGAEIEVGTTIQFQIRDAPAADDDLHHVLAGLTGAAALAFVGSGRGVGLFGEADHDAAVIADHVAGERVVGMFCDGEIGPIGGRHARHAMSACTLLFEERP